MHSKKNIYLTDCPRDAWQALSQFVPTEEKARHINFLIESGAFQCIDFGSFVSHKAVPQMKDTAQVVDLLENDAQVELLAIVANTRGASDGVKFSKINTLGYPFSISETFQLKNTKKNISDSLRTVHEIIEICDKGGKNLRIYLSMAFGNPYGDAWSEQRVVDWIGKLLDIGVKDIALADTTSEAKPKMIESLFESIHADFPNQNFGVHLHSSPLESAEKIQAALNAGCTRFEGALLGFGGCPFAKDELVGNIPSEELLEKFNRADKNTIQELINSFRRTI